MFARNSLYSLQNHGMKSNEHRHRLMPVSESIPASEPEYYRGQPRREARAELDVLQGLSNDAWARKGPAMPEGGLLVPLRALILLMIAGSACNKEQDSLPAIAPETSSTTKTSGQNWRLVDGENGSFTCPGRGVTCLVYRPRGLALNNALDLLFEAIESGNPSQPIAVLADHRPELSHVMGDSHINRVIDRSLSIESCHNEATGARFILLKDSSGALVFGYLIER